MCDDCARDPALREAWDEYHSMTANAFIKSSGDAAEFRLHVGLLHIAFCRAWWLSRQAIRPEFEAVRTTHADLLAAARTMAEHGEKAAYARGRADGMQYVIDYVKSQEAEAELRLRLARFGHKGTA